jgi:tetratricopeptide (TPR) repeat protein
MHLVGLFDRPANGDCLAALCGKPAIRGLTDALINLDETEWRRVVMRLRNVRLLTPEDTAAPSTLDAHPLVREWFGQQLELENPESWRAAHGRLFNYLRDTTREGWTPTLEDLAPLYQAIPHGCRAGRYKEALRDIYTNRICRWSGGSDMEAYAFHKIGAISSNLAAVSWFFEKPYETPVAALNTDRGWVLSEAAHYLRAQGRFTEALPVVHASLSVAAELGQWRNAAIERSNLSSTELQIGDVAAAMASAKESVIYADEIGDEYQAIVGRATLADALHTAGRCEEAEQLFTDVEGREKKSRPLLWSGRGFSVLRPASDEG